MLKMSSPEAARSLSFYRTAPQIRVTLDDFEELGNKRLKLLSYVSSQWHSHSTCEVQINFMNEVAVFQELLSNINADVLSHYALRLAFCRHRDSNDWNWLTAAEKKLQAIRLKKLPPFAAVSLLSGEGINYELLNASDPEDATPRQGIYRVPFADAPVLVKHREVVIHDGFCLVPLHKMNCVATCRFRQSLEEQMRDLHCAIPAQSLELERLVPILDGFVVKSRVLAGSVTKKSGRSKLEVANLDQVAEKHFPLCMKQLHRKLRENHHLKYGGRVQYRMFLKGAGFSVHECIQFFRSEFIKKISGAKFDKEYTYHIRHSYGLEGSRKEYAPLDCERIISGSVPSHGQYHGCPFRHWGRSALQNELCRLGLSLQTSMAITQQASTGHCQSACRALFDEMHPSTGQSASKVLHTSVCHPDTFALPGRSRSADIVMHPNLYLDASMATLD